MWKKMNIYYCNTVLCQEVYHHVRGSTVFHRGSEVTLEGLRATPTERERERSFSSMLGNPEKNFPTTDAFDFSIPTGQTRHDNHLACPCLLVLNTTLRILVSSTQYHHLTYSGLQYSIPPLYVYCSPLHNTTTVRILVSSTKHHHLTYTGLQYSTRPPVCFKKRTTGVIRKSLLKNELRSRRLSWEKNHRFLPGHVKSNN